MKTIADIQEAIDDAMQSDMEHGVAWMNEEAWKDFDNKYPELSVVLGQIADMEDV